MLRPRGSLPRQGRASWLAGTFGLVTWVLPSVGQAQDQEVAEALFQEGQRLMSEQRFAEACNKFADSLRADASVGTLLNLAHCRESEGRLATAWALYSKGANQARLAGQADRQAYAEQRVAELEPRLSRLTITLDSNADKNAVRVTLDSEPVSSAGFGFAFPVDPGSHQIVASQPGFETWQALVSFSARPLGQAGESKTLVIPLLKPAGTLVAPLGPAPTAAAQPTTPVPAGTTSEPAPTVAKADEEDEEDDDQDEGQDEEARQRFRAVVYLGAGGHNTWSFPQGIGGVFAHLALGVQKHFVPFLGFSARAGVTIEALFIGSGPPEVGSATTIFLDTALLLGPIGPWFVGLGPWLGINTFLDSAGGPNTVIGAQGVTGFMFGSQDQVQLTLRAQPGVWIDGASHFRGLFEFGIAFP